MWASSRSVGRDLSISRVSVQSGSFIGVNQLFQLRLLLRCPKGVAGDRCTSQCHQLLQTPSLLGKEEAVRAHVPDDHEGIGVFWGSCAARASRASPAVRPTAWLLPDTAR